MSAYDVVDGAHSAASKCNTELKRRWAIQGGEVTADSGTDDMELKVLTNWRGHAKRHVEHYFITKEHAQRCT
jgi:hypothetical protein